MQIIQQIIILIKEFLFQLINLHPNQKDLQQLLQIFLVPIKYYNK